jgi:hypothetical protein
MTFRSLLRPLVVALLAACPGGAWSADVASAASDGPFDTAPAVDLIPAEVPPPVVALTDSPDVDALRIACGRRRDYPQRREALRPAKAWNEARQAGNFASTPDCISRA